MLKPAVLLGKRLIQAESQNGAVKLEEGKVGAILRQGVVLDGVNIIQQELTPFMKQHFDTPAVHEKLREVTTSYSNSPSLPWIATAYEKLGGNAFARDKDVMKVMEPIIAPILELVCGKDCDIRASGLPDAFFELLFTVDDEIKAWFASNGSGEVQELKRARSNALVSFFGTRSFMGSWTIELKSDRTRADDFFTPLLGFVNTHLNLNLTPFVQQIMECKPEDRAEFFTRRARIAAFQQRSSMSSRSMRLEKMPLDAGVASTHQAERLMSPRSPRSPRSFTENAAAMKGNAHRLAVQDQARRKEVDAYSAQKKLPSISRDFFRKFKEEVLGLDRQVYLEVKGNWDAFCLQSLSLFIAETQAQRETVPENLLTLRDSLKEAVTNALSSNPESSTKKQ